MKPKQFAILLISLLLGAEASAAMSEDELKKVTEDLGATFGLYYCGGSKDSAPESAKACFSRGKLTGFRYALKTQLISKKEAEVFRELSGVVLASIETDPITSKYITEQGVQKVNHIVASHENGANADSNMPESDGVALEVMIVQAVVRIVFNEQIGRIIDEMSTERITQQLESWLTSPRDAYCRSDAGRGDLTGWLGGCQ